VWIDHKKAIVVAVTDKEEGYPVWYPGALGEAANQQQDPISLLFIQIQERARRIELPTPAWENVALIPECILDVSRL
jgi:hypothetical protein